MNWEEPDREIDLVDPGTTIVTIEIWKTPQQFQKYATFDSCQKRSTRPWYSRKYFPPQVHPRSNYQNPPTRTGDTTAQNQILTVNNTDLVDLGVIKTATNNIPKYARIIQITRKPREIQSFKANIWQLPTPTYSVLVY